MVGVGQYKEQFNASDPKWSSWVSAHAGSGKTKTLVDRLLRLFLAGVHPRRVLCLTFSNASRFSMMTRLYESVTKWQIQGQEVLKGDITALLGRVPRSEELHRARQLFEEILTVEDFVQTIHSFCYTLLCKIPFEAGLLPHFQLDLSACRSAMETAVQKLLSSPSPSLKESLDALAHCMVERTFVDLGKTLLGNPSLKEKLRRLPSSFPLSSPALHPLNVEDLRCALKGRKEESLFVLQAFLQQPEDKFEDYYGLFFTKTHKRRKAIEGEEVLYSESERVRKIKEYRVRKACFEATKHIGVFYEHLFSCVEEEKQRGNVVNYEDLLLKTIEILSSKRWVWDKEERLEHILLDEAQDNSLLQWKIVSCLCQQILQEKQQIGSFSGRGEGGLFPSVFVVGDSKQSIYAFQGARVEDFLLAREKYFGGIVFREEQLSYSFRSAQEILEVVDVIVSHFSSGGISDKRQQIFEQVSHYSQVGFRGGVSFLTDGGGDTEKVADCVIEEIERLCDKKAFVGLKSCEGRGCRPEDIMILCASRQQKMYKTLLYKLQDSHLPFHGEDRYVLSDYLYIQDLLRVARVSVCPEDDFNLACFLKSPLLSLSEQELLYLTKKKKAEGHQSLWLALQASKFHRSVEVIQALLDYREEKVFSFFSYVLEVLGGWESYSGEGGARVVYPIEVFLEKALAYDVQEGGGLWAFLEWFRRCEGEEIAPSMSTSGVRLMTIHQAKGLESPVVFLPDLAFNPHKPVKQQCLLQEQFSSLWVSPLYLPSKGESLLFMEDYGRAIKDFEREELLRLFYVALTRAQEHLYIALPEENCVLGEILHKAFRVLDKRLQKQEQWGLFGESLKGGATKEKAAQEETLSLPTWIEKPYEERGSHRRVRASVSLRQGGGGGGEGREIQEAAIYGRDFHKVLQCFIQAGKGAPFRKRLYKDVECEEMIERMQEDIEKIMSNPESEILFCSPSLFEVPLIGKGVGVEEEEQVGRLDQLMVMEKEVIFVEYKTSVKVPLGLEQVSLEILHQMKVYESLLKRIFPKKLVLGYLLWTYSGCLMKSDDFGRLYCGVRDSQGKSDGGGG